MRDKEIKSQLSEWGRWVMMNNDAGTGYARQSVIYRIMREGAGASIRTERGSFSFHIPDHISPIDKVVRTLPEKHLKIVLCQYTQSGRNKWKKFGVTKGLYWKTLDQAHWMIKGGLQIVITDV